MQNKYCFIVVIEDTAVFWTQLQLLLFSFRKNVQKYKNSKFWVLVNDGEVEQSKIEYLQNQFRPLEIVQKKSEINFDFNNKSKKTYRKYNAYIHFDQVDQFDRIIHLDADFIFTGDFVELLESDVAHFSAHPSGRSAVPSNYYVRAKQFLNYTHNEAISIARKWFLSSIDHTISYVAHLSFPNFNSGFLNMNKKSFYCIKNNIENYLKKIYIHNSPFCKGDGRCEQIALSLLVIHEIKNYSISSIRFQGPSCFHMFELKYGNAHYGGNRPSKNIPTSVEKIISEFKKCNYIQ